jgi:uncharacterized membrane protein
MIGRTEYIPSPTVSQTQAEESGDALSALAKSDTALTLLGRAFHDLTLISSLSCVLQLLNGLLFIIPILDAIAIMLMCLIITFTTWHIGNQSTATRVFKTVFALTMLALAVATFVISAHALSITLFSMLVVNRVWDIGVKFHSRFFGEHKQTVLELEALKEKLKTHEYTCADEAANDAKKVVELENKRRQSNGDLAESIHLFALSALSLAGIALLIPPFTGIGLTILLYVSVYSVIDKFAHNPLRTLANKLFDSPFEEVKTVDVAKPKMSTAICQERLTEQKDLLTPYLEKLNAKPEKVVRHPIEEVVVTPLQARLKHHFLGPKNTTEPRPLGSVRAYQFIHQ